MEERTRLQQPVLLVQSQRQDLHSTSDRCCHSLHKAPASTAEIEGRNLHFTGGDAP